jgi:serine/threonine-protein kinase
VQSPSFAILQPGAVFHGRYRVVRCIKAGGMGAVYEVVDDKTEARRALKVMLPSIVEDPDHRARFALEAKVTGGIESDHLVRVSDAGIDDATATPFIAMDLLRGEEVAQLVARRKALPPGEAIIYLYQAALALDKTHAAGIVHRDLKPENLFVTHRDDGSPCVKILDFGIAKVVARSHQAQATRALGTPLYMAPEQVRGEGDLDARADLYAMGHIAYTLLAGEPYWAEDLKSAESLFPMLTKLVAGAKEPPTARARRRTGAALPPGFDAWFFRATAVTPAERFDRASAMVTALAQATGVATPTPSLSTAQPFSMGPAQAAAPQVTPAVSTSLPSVPSLALSGPIPAAPPPSSTMDAQRAARSALGGTVMMDAGAAMGPVPAMAPAPPTGPVAPMMPVAAMAPVAPGTGAPPSVPVVPAAADGNRTNSAMTTPTAARPAAGKTAFALVAVAVVGIAAIFGLVFFLRRSPAQDDHAAASSAASTPSSAQAATAAPAGAASAAPTEQPSSAAGASSPGAAPSTAAASTATAVSALPAPARTARPAASTSAKPAASAAPTAAATTKPRHEGVF